MRKDVFVVLERKRVEENWLRFLAAAEVENACQGLSGEVRVYLILSPRRVK